MIDRGKRVVMLLDYKADEDAYPWLLDEFGYMWETPFDPLIGSGLPCNVQRPPDIDGGDARGMLYMLNHNINVEVSLAGQTFMIPAVSIANQTNAAVGAFSLGETAERCRQDWDRPPTVLNVDYYNHGAPAGSVFRVAAKMNGVQYNGTCCGNGTMVESGSEHFLPMAPQTLILTAILAAWVLWA